MLRRMKQKASSKVGESGKSQVVIDSNDMSTGVKSNESPMVSYVPISVGSCSTPSTNSSISSADQEQITPESPCGPQHAMVGFSRDGFEKNTKDSTNESSPSELASLKSRDFSCRKPISKKLDHKLNAMTSLVTLQNSPKTLVRKISACDFEEHPSPKKQKRDVPVTSATSSSASKDMRPTSMILLSHEQDESVLSPLHIFVRKQIEVFTATTAELQQPAPGRKQRIKLHQVGLRCIHCRHKSARKRVKRAVCYPSSVGRVYHSVSDMKFDHFTNCKDLPQDIRAEFEKLKAEGKKGKEKQTGQKSYPSSTAQYYHDAAMGMGMIDGPGGIFMGIFPSTVVVPPKFAPVSPTLVPRQAFVPDLYHSLPHLIAHGAPHSQGMAISHIPLTMLNTSLLMSVLAKANGLGASSVQSNAVASKRTKNVLPCNPQVPTIPSEDQTCMSLAEELDKQHLNALHCFVRKHVEIFTADESDITAPAPGRKSRVVLGQVGIRCIHCAKLPTKDRVKRAICYPPSVNGIYHSVSNMKFDHFGICRGLPPSARKEFASLRISCGRRGTSGNGGSRGPSSSTAKYYHSSAIRKGLVDTKTGIRLSKLNEKPAEAKDDLQPSKQERVPSPGMTALVQAASRAV